MPQAVLESVWAGLCSASLWAASFVILWFTVFWIAALAVPDPRIRPARDTDHRPTESSSLPILVPRELAGRMTLLAHKLQEDHDRGYLRLPHHYRNHVPIHYVIELGMNELEDHWDGRFRRPANGRPVHHA